MADQILIGDIRGKSGNRGQTGNTPIISVAMDNLSAGSTPTVDVSGSVDTPLITFGVPAQDAGTVIVFNHQSTQSAPTISVPQGKTAQEYWEEIYDLVSARENVRFFYNLGDEEGFVELNYYLQIADTPSIKLYMRGIDFTVWFNWLSDGTIDNYKYIQSIFVVEEGTKAIWHYKKWNNGDAECWADVSLIADGTTTTGLWGTWTTVTFRPNVQLPFTFVSTPYCFGQNNDTGKTGGIVECVTASTTKIETVHIRRGAEGAYNTSINVLIKGKWK